MQISRHCAKLNYTDLLAYTQNASFDSYSVYTITFCTMHHVLLLFFGFIYCNIRYLQQCTRSFYYSLYSALFCASLAVEIEILLCISSSIMFALCFRTAFASTQEVAIRQNTNCRQAILADITTYDLHFKAVCKEDIG